MKKILLVLVMVFAGFWAMPACTGGCTYDEFVGTCTGEGGGLFTFEGMVQGEEVTLTGNGLNEANALPAGESQSCKFMDASAGGCSPCLFDIGGPGDAAWELCGKI